MLLLELGKIMKKEMLLSKLGTLKSELVKKYKINNLALFGSYARNQQQDKSDIDLIVFSDYKNYFQLIEMENYISEKLDKKIDLGYYDSLKSYVKKTIENDIIYV